MNGLDVARHYLGLQEKADKIELMGLFKEAGITLDPSRVSWCAAFMNGTQALAGLPGNGHVNALSFLTYGNKIEDWDTVQEGDIVVFVFPDDLPGHGHVTYFVEWDDSNNTVKCLGGNQNNSVNISAYNQDYAVSIRRPN